MVELPARAPIEYSEIQRPYNTSRALGAVTIILLIVGWVAFNGETHLLLLTIPALAVTIDALYHRTHGASPFPGELIGTTMIVVALLLRGPAPGIHGLAIAWIVVSTALVLPIRQSTVLVFYTVSASVATFLLYYNTDLPLVGFVEGSDAEIAIDAVATVILLLVTINLILRVIRIVLKSQDRYAEALAQERRAVELKNEFVSMVSHELRTPLTGIAGFTDTLAESWKTLAPDEVDEFLKIMRHENDHLANLVEDILVIPRLEAGQLRLNKVEFDLSTEAYSVAERVFDGGEYSVTIPTNVTVYADRTRFSQILRNLLENAKKYGGDEVLIDAELHEPSLYKVSVSDNGPGVEEEDRERIFKNFEQVSTGDARLQPGFGLGLPIASKLSNAMGGDLWYEERFPVGARFCFSVTLAETDEITDDETRSEHVSAP